MQPGDSNSRVGPTEVFMGNPFTHIELNTTDLDQAKTFYGGLFDWRFEEVPIGSMTYVMIRVGSGTGGGMLKHPMPGAPSQWIPYVEVTDAAAATGKAKTLGARIIKEVTEVPNAGWFSIIVDPTGAVLGLWQSRSS
jgi:uncharacterized protein